MLFFIFLAAILSGVFIWVLVSLVFQIIGIKAMFSKDNAESTAGPASRQVFHIRSLVDFDLKLPTFQM